MEQKVYQNGDVYYGELKEGHKNGIGIFIRKNKFIYIGHWQKSNPIGKGLLVDKELIIFQDTFNNLYFEQSVKNEFINCFYRRKPHKQLEGIFKFDNKIIKGNILCTKRPLMCTEFSGFYEMRNNHQIYKGFFKNNQLQKIGQINSSKELFIGNFIDNKKNGFGIQELFLDKENIIRKYINDQPQNNTIFVSKEMFCIQIELQGIQSGLICYQDNSIYFGQLIQKKNSNSYIRHGFGCYYEDNKYFIGEWNYGKRQGLGYEVKYKFVENQNQDNQTSKHTESEILRFLMQYSQIYKQYYQQFVAVDKFFQNKNKEYNIDTEFIGQWNNDLKNGEGIFQSVVTEVNGIWRNGQLIKKSEQENFEYLNQFEKKDFYSQGQIYVLQLLSQIGHFKKECYSDLDRIIKKYQKNQKFLQNLSYNETDLIARKQLLQNQLDETAFKISKKCKNVKIKKILLDPFNYLQIKQQDQNTQTLYNKLMTSLIEKQKNNETQKEFITNIKKDTKTRETIFKKLNSFYNVLQNSNGPKITFQQNNILNELYTDMNIRSSQKQKPRKLDTFDNQFADPSEAQDNESGFPMVNEEDKKFSKKNTEEKISQVEVVTPLETIPNSFQKIQEESQVKKLDHTEFKTFEIGEMDQTQKKNQKEDKPFDPFSSGSEEEDQQEEKPFDPFSSGSDVEEDEPSQDQQQDEVEEVYKHPFLSEDEEQEVPVKQIQNNGILSEESQDEQNNKQDQRVDTFKDLNVQEMNNGFLSQESIDKDDQQQQNSVKENNEKTQNIDLQELNGNFLSQEGTEEEQAQINNMTTQEHHNFFQITNKNSKANQTQTFRQNSSKKGLNIIPVDSAEDVMVDQSQSKKVNVVQVDSVEDVIMDKSQSKKVDVIMVDSMEDIIDDKDDQLKIQAVDSEILDEPVQDQNGINNESIQRKITGQGITSKQVNSFVQEDYDLINSEDSKKIIDISVEEEKQRIKEQNEQTLIKNQTMIDEYLPKFSSLNQSQQVQANLKKKSDNDVDYFNEFSSLDDEILQKINQVFQNNLILQMILCFVNCQFIYHNLSQTQHLELFYLMALQIYSIDLLIYEIQYNLMVANLVLCFIYQNKILIQEMYDIRIPLYWLNNMVSI